ncbi:MAG: hypothetical protein ABR600_03765 [Actinomycetota bacterium]
MPSPLKRFLLLAASLAALGVVAGLFLSLYADHRFEFPVGYDTPKYVWRANLVEAQGPSALANSAQPPLHVNADRPGYPVLAALLHAVTGTKPFDLTFVLPAVIALVIGLCAGAFAVRILREPPWAFPVYAIGVGASVNVALIAIGYADTLLASAVLLAAATTAVAAAGGERGMVGTVALVAGAATIHWNFAVMFLAILLGLLVLLLPESRSARRAGASFSRTPSGRLGITVGASALAGAATVLLGPAGPASPSLGGPEFRAKLHRDVPSYRFWATGPAAALGARLLWRGDHVRRRGLALAVVWAGAGAGAVVLLLMGVAAPAHRILAFAFGIPILVAAAAVGLARLLAVRLAVVGAVIGAAVVLAALAGQAFLGHRVWASQTPWAEPDGFIQAGTAGNYLKEVGGDRPAVFVIDRPTGLRSRVNLPFRVIRSAVPVDQIRRTYVYLGTVDDLLAGRPTTIAGNADFNELSQEFFDGLRPVLSRDPIVLTVDAFNQHFGALAKADPSALIAPGVLLVRGPAPTDTVAEPVPPQPHSNAWLAALTAAILAILFVAGIGWSVTLASGPLAVRAALAPAFGIAALALAGLLADQGGVGSSGASGVAVVSITAAAGWGALAARGLWGTSSDPDDIPPSQARHRSR